MLINNDNYSSSKSVDRSTLKRTQTPQAFRYGKIVDLYRTSINQKNNLIAPCDIVSHFDEKVYFSKGSEKNLKITTPDDIEIFKALLHVEKHS
jgi:2-C-methyl-D-erythritol 4-phosphate cytidylyltransferase